MTRRLILAGASLFCLAVPAGAETLREAMVKAYRSNPTLTAQRATLRATDENVPIARSNGLPGVTTSGSYTENVLNAGNSIFQPARQLNGQAQVSVPLYQGGAVKNAVSAAKVRVDSGRAQLRGTEAETFTAVVAAYMDVIRDEAIVGLNTQNVRVLEVNLQASRDRFQVGDLTRTDVAQSEARLAQARAQLQSAQAQLIGSRETYVRVVGDPPAALEQPPALPNLPSSPETAVARALQDNPTLIAANKERDATRYDIGVARATRLPKVNAVGGASYYNYLNSLDQSLIGNTPLSGTAAQAGVQFTLPLFQGGQPGARVRQAEAFRSQAIENATATERSVVAQTRSAYASWTSAQEVIASSEVAVNANKLSLEGVRAENSVGTRTVLDILNAEQELLNSQVTLVTARRDAYVAGFALLAAMGNAEARDLGLDGGPLYDPVANYKRVSHSINDFAGDGDPKPVATGTAATPAQTARVAAPRDPLLEDNIDRTPALTTGEDAPSRR